MNGFERRRRAKMEKIESAAQKLFLERGLAATSVERIASEAGVSKVSLYHYYGNKQGLARAIVFAALERQDGEFRRVMQSPLSFREKFERLTAVKAEAMRGLSGAGGVGLLEQELLNSPEMRSYLAEYNAARALPLLTALIEQGKREGEIHPEIPTGTILLYIQSLQALMTSPITPRQREDLGRLFRYGFKGKV